MLTSYDLDKRKTYLFLHLSLASLDSFMRNLLLVGKKQTKQKIHLLNYKKTQTDHTNKPTFSGNLFTSLILTIRQLVNFFQDNHLVGIRGAVYHVLRLKYYTFFFILKRKIFSPEEKFQLHNSVLNIFLLSTFSLT